MGRTEVQHLSNPFPACSLCGTGLGPGLHFAASAPRWQHPHPKTTPSPFGLLCSLNAPLKTLLKPPLKPPRHRHAANARGKGPPARDTPNWGLLCCLGHKWGARGKALQPRSRPQRAGDTELGGFWGSTQQGMAKKGFCSSGRTAGYPCGVCAGRYVPAAPRGDHGDKGPPISLTVLWEMVRQPYFTPHFLFCHTLRILSQSRRGEDTPRSPDHVHPPQNHPQQPLERLWDFRVVLSTTRWRSLWGYKSYFFPLIHPSRMISAPVPRK